jgi:hypothetical protein
MRKGNSRPVTLIRTGFAVAALALAMVALAGVPPLMRPAPTPTKGTTQGHLVKMQTAENLPVPVSQLQAEVNTLKQQVSLLQQQLGQTEQTLATLKQQFDNHWHPLGIGFVTEKTILSGGCPNCMIAFTVPGKAPMYTGKPVF